MRTPLLAALLLPALVHAQADYLAGVPVWAATEVCNQAGFGGGPCITTDRFNYKLAGDSVVNGITYTKVERTGHVDPMWMGGPPVSAGCINDHIYGPELRGLIRQEGRTFRIWDGESDVLLFDFDLEVGEYLPVSANNFNNEILVTAMDSIEMNGEWRRVYTVQGDWTTTIVEGVGSDKGLFEPVSTALECGFELNCFSLGGQAYYPAPGPDCDLHIGLAEIERPRLILAPNPTAGPLQLELPTDITLRTVEVLDLQGRVRSRMPVQGTPARIDLGGSPDGVYVVQIGPYRERVVLLRQ